MKSQLDSILGTLKTPLRGSIDPGIIADELDIHESAGVGYIRRAEDSLLEHALLNSGIR